MRRCVVAWVIVIALSGLATIEASSAQTESGTNVCQALDGRGGYICPWGFQETMDGAGRSGGATASGGGPTPRVVYVDEIITGPDGNPCLSSRAVPLPDGDTLAPGTDLGSVTGPIGATYQRCPATPGSPAAPVIDPRTVAVQGWEEVDLPGPQPYIAPGWAITGKPSYLETRGQLRHQFTKDTPIGPLQIDSVASYYVDWGDGDSGGPFSVEGGPWPNGQISHTYINVGTYDVAVTEHWTANWQLGSASGQLTGQQTSGGIAAFRVEQVQAVIGTG